MIGPDYIEEEEDCKPRALPEEWRRELPRSPKPQPTLKTQYKYIHFVTDGHKQFNTVKWDCLSRKDDVLGIAHFSKEWRCWVFMPYDVAEFSADCLRDCADFLRQLNEGVK